MAIFAIIKQPGEPQKLAEAVRTNFPGSHYDLGNGAWLVAATSTAQEVSNRLEITSGANGSALILEVGSYFGRANPAIWSWMKANWEGVTLG